jgi:hypothetical protein
MTLETPMRCSALSESLGESLGGTVEQRTRWLLLEDRSAWGTDAVKDLFGTDAAARAKQLGLRLLLVRRREGDPAADTERRAMLIDTVSREMAVRVVGDPADLSVEAAAGDPVGSFGAPMTGPMFLVCTNGKRDACCALRGRALMTALSVAHAESVWECTHLGGHRFAGNLVCLPDGILYGRVSALDGPSVLEAYLAGRVEAALMRGRSAWPAPAQVAEVLLRERLGLTGVEDVRLVGASVRGDVAEVALATPDGESHPFVLRAERSAPPRPISCRADELEAPVHWVMAEG